MLKRNVCIGIIMGILLMCAAPLMAGAAASYSLSLLGQTAPDGGGQARGICMNDNYVFVNCGTSVEIYSYDKENASAAEYLTKVDFTSNGVLLNVNSMAVYENEYLLVSYGKGGSNTNTGYSRTIIYNVATVGASSPSALAAVKTADATVAVSMSVGGEYVYAINDYSTLAVFKLSDALALSGATKTYTELGNKCKVYNLAEPASNKSVTSMYIDGDYLYYANRCRLNVLNISDPADVYCCGYTGINGDVSFSKSMIAVKGDYVFVSTREAAVLANCGVYVFDASACKANKAAGTIVAPEYVNKLSLYWAPSYQTAGILINGDYLYVSYQDLKRLYIYDISDPKNIDFTSANNSSLYYCKMPDLVSGYSNAYGLEGMCLKGNRLYFTDRAYGFRIARVSAGSEPGALYVSNGATDISAPEQGNLKGRAVISNVSSEPLSGVLILAYYNGNTLISVKSKAVTAASGEIGCCAETDALTVAGASGDSVKAMLWTDITGNLTPILSSKTVK